LHGMIARLEQLGVELIGITRLPTLSATTRPLDTLTLIRPHVR
jgi:hypothetical protein